MTLSNNVKQFATENHQGVLTCFRRNGMPQMSIVTCGAYRDGVAFSTTEDRAKMRNLERDPRCSLLVSKDNWWGYVVLEGRAQIISSKTATPDELRDAMRDVYRAAAGKEHPDWDEYRQAMVDQRKCLLRITPRRWGPVATGGFPPPR